MEYFSPLAAGVVGEAATVAASLVTALGLSEAGLEQEPSKKMADRIVSVRVARRMNISPSVSWNGDS
jgi:hypothetical protein